MRKIVLSALTLVIVSLFSLTVRAQVLKDFDGNVYPTVKFGLQVWTGSNLNVSHFRNGDAIPEAKTEEEWIKAASEGAPAWCHYDNSIDNGKRYGKLYNWFAINDPRGLAPEGWHIPASLEWSTLIKNLKGVDIAGTKLKSAAVWKNKKGTNDIGFAGVPSGYRTPDGKFKNLGIVCQWWSSSVPVDVRPSDKIYSLELNDNSVEIKFLQSEKGAGLSVRCEKD